MPLEEIDGLQLGDPVAARSEDARVEVGPGLLGRVIDGFGGRWTTGPAIEVHDTYSLHGEATNPLEPRAHHAAAGDGDPRDRRLAAVRQGAAHRDFRRERRGQEHAARVDVAAQFGGCDGDCDDRRAQSRGARVSGERAWAGGAEALGGGVRDERAAGAAAGARVLRGAGGRGVFPRSGGRTCCW